MQAELNFCQPLSSPLEPLDFNQPGTEKKYEALERLYESHSVQIHDVRTSDSAFTLGRNGFEYAEDGFDISLEGKTDDEVKDLLIPLTENLVQKVTGAFKTITITSRVRSLAEDPNKRADNRAPAHSVHTDFTPAGALQQLSKILANYPEEEAKKLQSSRVMVINVWRPLKTIEKDPLAICDWTSVETKDIIPYRMIFQGGSWIELGKVTWNDKQDWYTLKRQAPSEPLLFKQFDGRVADGGMTVPHSAFVDPQYEDAEARKSIEIKMFAFVEE